MRCDPEAVSTFVSGELPGTMRQRVEAHLAECDACRTLVDEYGHIRALIRDLPTHAVPDVVELGVRGGLRRRNLGRGWVPPFRMVASMAAVIVLLLLVGYGVLGKGLGMMVGAQPVVVESRAGTQDEESGEHTMVEIVFDRPMDQGSVEGAINISPPVQTSGLNWKEQGKVLEIPLQPERDTTYTVVIDNRAKDSKGNALKSPYVLEFSTDPTGLVAAPPRKTPTPTVAASASPSPSRASFAIAALTTSPSASAITTTVGPQRSATTTPTSTSTSRPAISPSVVPGTPSPTPSPTITGTVTAIAGCPSPSGAFGRLYSQNTPVRAALGCFIQAQKDTWMASQSLEHGYMFWREDTRRVYVLQGTGKWTEYADTWKEGDPEAGEGIPPLGMYKPIRGLGQVWQEQPGLRESLGWAIEPERGYSGGVQYFSRGIMLLTDQNWIYVLHQDGTWQKFRTPAD